MAFLCGTGRSAPKDTQNAPIKKTIGPTNPNASQWDTTEVLEWLHKINKQEYSSEFQRNNINGKRLLKLQSDDLKQTLNIVDTEDRKHIKKEISKLKGKDPNKLQKSKSNLDNNHINGTNGRHRNDDRNNDKNNKDNYGGGSNLSKSKSAYFDMNSQSNYHHNHNDPREPRDPREVEFSNQPPYGRGGFDSDTFANDKKQDKQQYYQYWQTIVRNNSDILLKTQYDIIMNGSNLPQQDQTLIWQLATVYNQGRCTFEQFADIIKLTFIASSGVPLYLINTQKLIWFHPPVPMFIQNYQPYDVLAQQQAKQNTVAFRGIPASILESDERLMKFAELALHQYEPVHFEINENVLIATFKSVITPNDLAQLRNASLNVIQSKFGIVHVNGRNLLMTLEVDFPTGPELGLTPQGPQGPQGLPQAGPVIPSQGQPSDLIYGSANGMMDPMQSAHPHQAPPRSHQAPPHQPNGAINGYSGNQSYGGQLGPQQYGAAGAHTNHPYGTHNSHSQPQHSPNLGPHHDPYHSQPNGALPPPPHPNHGMHSAPNMANPQMQGPPHMMNGQPHGAPHGGHGHANGNYNGYANNNNNNNNNHNSSNGYGAHGNGMQPQARGGPAPPGPHGAAGQMQTTPDITPRAMTQAKKQELLNILLSESFWDEFRMRSNIDQYIPNEDTKIRTKAAMQLIAGLRQVPLRTVNYLDKGVKELQLQTKAQLRQEMNDWTLIRLAALLDIPENEIPEVYKGIIIEGLPDMITADDDTIRKLDSEVLFSFIVSHIEVVDNVLRITFKKDVSQSDIDKLRRGLKTFLRDIMKLEKKAMKNVSLIPHTRDTWRGETTTSEYDDVDPQAYGNEV